MTVLRERMIGDLKLRNFSENTIHTYTRIVEEFAGFFHRSPDRLGPEEIRKYLLHAVDEKKLAWSTYQVHRAALKFIYTKTLKRPWFEVEIPRPKIKRKLPQILSSQEIEQVLNATVNLKHRAIIATLYGAGLRRAEVRTLKVGDIDSHRMVIHVRDGKENVPRDVTLSPKRLELLRVYWRWRKPKDWLFPSACYPDRVRIYASFNPLLGHADLKTTARYLHVSKRTLSAVVSPLDGLQVIEVANSDGDGR